MAVTTEGNYLSDFLKWEEFNRYSRDKVIFAAGNTLSLGEVVGRITKALGTESADGGNTGDGALSGISLGPKAKTDNYTLECITAAADGGTFKVIAPDGSALPDAEVGVAYANEQINFTITDGATDFAVGDTFTIPVEEGSGKAAALDPSAVDGTQVAAGIAITGYDASLADIEGVIIVRDAVVADSALVWPDGISTENKEAAKAQLKSSGIIFREEA
jgi:predicted RecA/RadA family phage recombinase